jgi:hypothetical protein
MRYPMSMNDLHAPAPAKVRCPACGAKNAPDAEWCGQCLRRFEAVPPPPPPAAAPDETAPATGSTAEGVTPGVQRGDFRSTEEGILWRCSSCETENRLEESACKVCGKSFAEAMKPPAPERPARDPGMTAMLSLFFPGAGHAVLGMWPQAIARAVINVWVLLMALFFAIGGQEAARPVALVYAAAAFGLWGTAAHDAYREANGESRDVILQGRRFTYVVLSLLMLLLASLFLLAFSNR